MYCNYHNPFQEERERWELLVEDIYSTKQLKSYASGNEIIRTFSKLSPKDQSFLYCLKNEKAGYIGESGPNRLHYQQRNRHSKDDHPADLILLEGKFDFWVCVLDKYPMSRRDELLKIERYYIEKYRNRLNLINDKRRKDIKQNILNPPATLEGFFNG